MTSTSILYHLAKHCKNLTILNSTRNNSRRGRNKRCGCGTDLVCAPSNVAVEQLTEKINRTSESFESLPEVENVESNVEDLCLHNMVRR